MIVELLLGSGLRVSEACALTVGDVHLQGESPAVFVRLGKGGRPRLVPISSRLAAVLLDFTAQKAVWGEPLAAQEPVFLGQHGVSLTRFGMTKIWKAALRCSGLQESWGIHATRHTYAVEVYGRTQDLRLTQRLLGHASVVTTCVYASLLDERVRAGVERIWA
jgi:site-specific recombinase XerD